MHDGSHWFILRSTTVFDFPSFYAAQPDVIGQIECEIEKARNENGRSNNQNVITIVVSIFELLILHHGVGNYGTAKVTKKTPTSPCFRHESFKVMEGIKIRQNKRKQTYYIIVCIGPGPPQTSNLIEPSARVFHGHILFEDNNFE